MLETLILELYSYEMIKFGNFTLKSGIKSPVYIDLRNTISYPHLFTQLCDLVYQKMQELNYDMICGVAYSALTFASAIAYTHKIPMLLKPKELKNYGIKKIITGNYNRGDHCLIIEDVISTAQSVLENTKALTQEGIVITDVVCFLDRDHGAKENLAAQNYQLHSIITLGQIIEILYKHQKITLNDYKQTLIGCKTFHVK